MNDALTKAEGIYKQLRDCKDLPEEIGDILGLHQPSSTLSSASSASSSPRKQVKCESNSTTVSKAIPVASASAQDNDSSLEVLSESPF